MTRLRVGAPGDRYEREADGAAQRVLRRRPAGTGRTQPVGGRLDAATRRRFEGALGADLSRVRVRTGRDVDEVSDELRAHAFTVGREVYVRRADYRPGTRAGDALLAHELTHATQRAPADVISLKRRKMHLDFVRMKRKNIRWGRAARKVLGLPQAADPQGHGIYGHWWTEIGDLSQDPNATPDNRWHARQSYGWWPHTDAAGGWQATWQGMPGQLNQGEDNDPHHNEPAPVEFHPVMDVDDSADYTTFRNTVTQDIRTFARDFDGVWNWRLGWGQNCQTFQKALKKRLGLHYTKSKDWFADPRPAQEAKRQAAAGAMLAEQATQTFKTRGHLQLYHFPAEQRRGVELTEAASVRPDQTIGVTGVTRTHPSVHNDVLVEVIWDGQRLWSTDREFSRTVGEYPAARGNGGLFRTAERGRGSVSDSDDRW
jgi:hypothetical protein